MDTVKLFRMHSRVAKFHMIFYAVFVAYAFVMNALGYREINSYEAIALAIVFVIVSIDFLMSLRLYNNSFLQVRIIRVIEALLMSMASVFFVHRSYISILASVVCILLIMQISYLTNIKRAREKYFYFACTMAPIFFLSIITAASSKSVINIIDTMAFVIFFMILIFTGLIFTSYIFEENKIEKKKLETELIIVKDNFIERLNRENSEMLIENLIQQYISSSLEISNLMKLILESLSEAMVVNLCSIIVIDESDNICKYSSRSTYSREMLEHFNSYVEGNFKINRLRKISRPFIDNDVVEGKYGFLRGGDIKSLLIHPLRNGDQVLGVLIIGKDKPGYFKKHMAFFERLSTQFSIALTNASTYKKMENMAIKDGLTGIYNRGYLSKLLNEYVSEAIIKHTPFSIIMFDIDDFKAVNDIYGHMFGDEAIRVCANAAKETAQKYGGIAARYGGEEFVIINTKQDFESQKEMAELLQNKLKGTVVEYRGQSVKIDISIGVASYPETCDNPAELIDRADEAMYNSKKSGKGRISYD